MAPQTATRTAETSARPRQLGRSAIALFIGLVVGVVLSLGTDFVLHLIGVFPALGEPVGSKPLLLATIYRTIYSVLACYVTARFAPDRPMEHALTAGAIGFTISTLGAIVTWNRGPQFGPHWYPVALIALAMPSAWLGGRLRRMQP